MSKKNNGPKVLILDIETAPVLGYVWALWDQNVALNQIKADWFILSWSAKWLGDPENKTMYMDSRNKKNVEDDSDLLKGIWKLLDKADVTITHNGKKFDHKKLNARFLLNGMEPPSSFKTIDTLTIVKKHFALTSNKLEYIADKLCKKYKKFTNRKFSGFALWTACLARNKEAWKEMEVYNKHDVLALEEVYNKLKAWDNSINFNLYKDNEDNTCKCGSLEFKKNGYFYTATSKFQRYKCVECGSETRGKKNLFSKEKRESLRSGTVR